MKRDRKGYVLLSVIAFFVIGSLVGCSAKESNDDSHDTAVRDSTDNSYVGMWLTMPSGQEGYQISAEGIWIKSASENQIEYETAYFIGNPDSDSHRNYTWSILRHTAGTSEVTESDVAGIKCFNADGENIYLGTDKLYFGKYQNEDLEMVETGFESFDDCIYYYNCDYGYCYNIEGGVTLAKHGINIHFMDDEYWYLRFKKFTNGNKYIEIEQDTTGSSGTWMSCQCFSEDSIPGLASWYANLMYDKIDESGAFIYNLQKTYDPEYSYTLYYYPSDCHIHIETENAQVAGDYYYEDIPNDSEWKDILTETGKENESELDKGISGSNENSTIADNSVETNLNMWFLDYDSFYHVRVGDELSVYAMNDALLFVSFSGVNGDSMEWELNLEPDDAGSDGELIYYYGKDFSLSYYPSDHHIYIETSDDLYSGEYWPNE